MGWWGEHALPRLTDVLLRGHEIGELRGEACAGLHGSVLEIGFGSGLNVRWYPPEVTEVHAVEPADTAWRLSARRRDRTVLPIERTGLDGQRLDAADASYDCALSTFTLCSIPDVPQALAEVRRVLRPGGAFHYLEHGLAPDPGVVRWQRRLEPAQRLLGGGCHLTRDIAALLTDAGFHAETAQVGYLSGPDSPSPWVYLYRGRVTA
jgi:SAM-dependent methyltransferase